MLLILDVFNIGFRKKQNNLYSINYKCLQFGFLLMQRLRDSSTLKMSLKTKDKFSNKNLTHCMQINSSKSKNIHYFSIKEVID